MSEMRFFHNDAEPRIEVKRLRLRLGFRLRALTLILRFANWWIRRRLTPEQRQQVDEISRRLEESFLTGEITLEAWQRDFLDKQDESR